MSDISVQRQPVHVDFISGGEVASTGIAFEDYTRMSTQFHKLAASRRYEMPAWAANDEQTCAVIARSMEGRAGLRIHEGTDNIERLEKAQRVLKAKAPQLVARLDGLCRRFVAAKNGGDAKYAASLGIQIEGHDTQLRILDHTAEMLGGVIYFYWRCGFNSVETGQQLGIKPTHVRQTTLRLVEVGIELGYGAPLPIARRPAGRVMRAAVKEGQYADIIRLHKEGRFTVDIARELGLGKNGSEIVNSVLIQAGLR